MDYVHIVPHLRTSSVLNEYLMVSTVSQIQKKYSIEKGAFGSSSHSMQLH